MTTPFAQEVCELENDVAYYREKLHELEQDLKDLSQALTECEEENCRLKEKLEHLELPLTTSL